VLAPLVAPYAFDALDLARRRGAPSLHHLFGTDELGRDLLTRILYGARISLAIGLVSAALSAAIGVTVGAAAGFAAASSTRSSCASPTRCSPCRDSHCS
jgi:ABC-type dipeptide/oligopeptide/nickel transport system permease subunit